MSERKTGEAALRSLKQLIEKQLQLLEGVEKDGVIGVVRQGQAEERGEGKKEARKRLFWQSGQDRGELW